MTVVGELCPVIWFLSHTTALPFLKKKIPCIFTGLVSLLSEYPSHVATKYEKIKVFPKEVSSGSVCRQM
jgi:hypothetical protein